MFQAIETDVNPTSTMGAIFGPNRAYFRGSKYRDGRCSGRLFHWKGARRECPLWVKSGHSPWPVSVRFAPIADITVLARCNPECHISSGNCGCCCSGLHRVSGARLGRWAYTAFLAARVLQGDDAAIRELQWQLYARQFMRLSLI
jgi:hypothetical protein